MYNSSTRQKMSITLLPLILILMFVSTDYTVEASLYEMQNSPGDLYMSNHKTKKYTSYKSYRSNQNQGKSNSSLEVVAPRDEQVIRTIKVVATGYTAGYESTGKKPNHPQYGITYSGVKVRRDKSSVSTIAADLKVFPLGTILYIPGYGYGIVADKGSAIKGKKIDLYFSTVKQVYKEWGKKEIEVQVIKRGGGKVTEKMLKALGKAIEVNKQFPDSLLEKAI